MTNIIQARAHFNPVARGRSLCVGFDNVVKTFHSDKSKRIAGLLSADIYDVPCFSGDKVMGGPNYTKFITTSPDYYLYRVEPDLLRSFVPAIREQVGTSATVYDLGPGPAPSVEGKTITVLRSIVPYHVYKPVDNAPAFICEAEEAVRKAFPERPVKGEVLNFQQEELPPAENDKSLILYLGSTISNAPSKPDWTFMNNPYYEQYLGLLRRSAAKEGYLVLTHDSNQDEKTLLASYGHESMAKFFVNVAHKIKRDLLSDDMDADAFKYECHWNKYAHCIEHNLVPTNTQTFTIHDPFNVRSAQIKVVKGERYIPVNSYKPSAEQMQQKLLQAGWTPIQYQLDEETGFLATHLCIAS